MPRLPGDTREAVLERRLVRAARLGDEDAFAEIVRLHGAMVHRFVRGMVHDDGEAREVVQDTFVAAWTGLDTFAGRSALRTWLLGIARRRAVDALRRRRPTPVEADTLERELPATLDLASQGALDQALLDALDVALAELGESARAVWLLREVEGLSYRQIATTLGTTPTAVRGQLERARRRLAESMESYR